MINLEKLTTEKSNPLSTDFSSMTIRESIEIMNQEDFKAVECIKEEIPKIGELINHTSAALKKGGRIIYIGAGTSGRLGVLDAVECPPTFGVDYETVVGIIAGGEKAFIKAKEGAEDNKDYARQDLKEININENDVVIGIAASGRTPYVIGGLEYANEVGSYTGSIACTKDSEIGKVSKTAIEAVPGPEVLTGSTRLKAGTTTKLILNMISTISMKEIGKIYKNYMVDLKLSNKKLSQRGINIVKNVTEVSESIAKETLEKADGHVKLAIVMILLDLNAEQARKKLKDSNGIIDNIE